MTRASLVLEGDLKISSKKCECLLDPVEAKISPLAPFMTLRV